MRAFFRQLRPALATTIVMTILCGVIYPMLVTAVGQVAFHGRVNGSLVHRDGNVVGSSLIGQAFTEPGYFHSRPSAAGTGYDGSASSGSNLGPSNQDLLTAISDRVKAYRTENRLDAQVQVPVDAVTASASGLDPEITVANARLQAARVASARSLPMEVVLKTIDAAKVNRPLGFLGDDGVNVLKLNLALDALLKP
jgi:potassium-transporting ATPase KdpC subunit